MHQSIWFKLPIKGRGYKPLLRENRPIKGRGYKPLLQKTGTLVQFCVSPVCIALYNPG